MKRFNVTDIARNLSIKNNVATLNIYGDIVASELDRWYEEDVCPDSISRFIKDVEGTELHIHINSGGGSAFAGIAIYNILRNRAGKTIVYIDALAASAASVIAFAGDEIVMPKGSMIMVHRPWTGVIGNSEELRKQAEFLDSVCDSLLEIYKDNLNSENDFDKIKEYVNAETYLNGESCAELFNHVVVDNSLNACACVESEYYNHYKHLPKNLKFVEEPLHQPVDNKNKKYEVDRMLMKLEIDEVLNRA